MQVFMKRMSWVAAVAALTMFASAASATVYTEQWEMSANPTTTAGVGVGTTWTTSPGLSGLSDNGDGTFKYTDSGSTGNLGSFFTLAQLALGQNATIDFRMKVDTENNSANTGAFGVVSLGQNVRGLNMRAGQIGFNNNPDFVSSTAMNTSVMTFYRLIMTGNNFDLYLGETGTLLATTSGGGSGANVVGTGPCFQIGAYSNGTVQSLVFDLDWVRVGSGTGSTTHYDTPEPASLALLALGGIPMMMRRRRAA